MSTNLSVLAKAAEAARLQFEKKQAELVAAQKTALTKLPLSVGLKSVDQLIKALAPHSSPFIRGKLAAALSRSPQSVQAATPAATTSKTTAKVSAKAPRKAPKGTKKGAKNSRKQRTTVTPEIREKVRDMAKAGKTHEEISEVTGISLATVQNIKNSLGLTKRRSDKAKPAEAK